MDWQDDEQKSKPMDEAVKSYLLQKQQRPIDQKYAEIADDNSAIEKARADADSKKMWLGVTQGIGQMLAGDKVSDSAFSSFRKDLDNRVADAESDKKAKLDATLRQDQLARMGVERQREDTKWERSEADAKTAADPTSTESQLAQRIASKMLPGQDFSKYTAAQIYKALPFVERQATNEIQLRKLNQADDRIGISREGLGLRKEKEGRLEEQFKVGQGNRLQDEAAKTLQLARNTETWKSAEKTLSNVPTMRNLLKDAYEQGGQSLAMLGPQVAKGIAGEVGVLTDKDVTRYVQNPALVPGMMDTIAKLSEGKVSEVSYENLNRLLDIAEQAAKDKMGLALQNDAELYSRRRQGLTPEQALFLIDPTAQKPSEQLSASPAPTASKFSPEQEARIKANMDKYGKSREDIIKAMQKKGIL